MMTEWLQDISVGQWYQADSEPFEIVAIDPENETIEVQYFDGTVEEFDFDSWMELAARPVAPPEDWSGALDVEREDYGVERDVVSSQGWENPLDRLDTL